MHLIVFFISCADLLSMWPQELAFHEEEMTRNKQVRILGKHITAFCLQMQVHLFLGFVG